MIPYDAIAWLLSKVRRDRCHECRKRIKKGEDHLLIEERNRLTPEAIAALPKGESLDLGTFRVLCDKCYRKQYCT